MTELTKQPILLCVRDTSTEHSRYVEANAVQVAEWAKENNFILLSRDAYEAMKAAALAALSAAVRAQLDAAQKADQDEATE